MTVAGFAALFYIDERADAERVEKIDRLASIVIAVRVRLIEFRVWIGSEVCGIFPAIPKAHVALREHREQHSAVGF